jgi:hypothetical protein
VDPKNKLLINKAPDGTVKDDYEHAACQNVYILHHKLLVTVRPLTLLLICTLRLGMAVLSKFFQSHVGLVTECRRRKINVCVHVDASSFGPVNNRLKRRSVSQPFSRQKSWDSVLF